MHNFSLPQELVRLVWCSGLDTGLGIKGSLVRISRQTVHRKSRRLLNAFVIECDQGERGLLLTQAQQRNNLRKSSKQGPKKLQNEQKLTKTNVTLGEQCSLRYLKHSMQNVPLGKAQPNMSLNPRHKRCPSSCCGGR